MLVQIVVVTLNTCTTIPYLPHSCQALSWPHQNAGFYYSVFRSAGDRKLEQGHHSPGIRMKAPRKNKVALAAQ